MKINDLLSPGLLSNGIRLRVEAAKAISSVQITCMRTPGGKTTSAKTLSDFFSDCATQLASLYDVTVAAFGSVTSATATSATQINIVFPEAMDTGVTPAAAAFAVSGDTVTAVAWTSSTNLRLTGTGFAAAESLVYTKPATNALRDRAGNQTATGTKVLV
jgi:hypothetical protein